jgi:hypothetical protein
MWDGPCDIKIKYEINLKYTIVIWNNNYNNKIIQLLTNVTYVKIEMKNIKCCDSTKYIANKIWK